MQITSKITFYVFSFLLLAIALFFLYQTYYFAVHTHQQIIADYLQTHRAIYKPLVWQQHYFTPQTYRQALWWLCISDVLIFFLNILLWRYKSFCQHIISESIKILALHFHLFRKYFKSFSKIQIGVMIFTLLSILWHQVYIYGHTFVAMDESFSWLFFASQGSFVTISHYPVPNNHIFYNLCSIFWSNFISDPILAMRLSSILSFWVLLFIVFYYFLRISNFQTAIVALMLIGLGFSQSIFAVQGRGYMLVALCFFIALWSLQAYLQSYKKGYMVLFVKACVIGFWTIPVFLYVFLSFYAYLLFFTWKQEARKETFRDFVGAGILIGILVYLCYCPVLVYSGFSALAGNENVSPKTYDSAWFFGYILSIALRESVIYVMSLPKYVSFILFAFLGIIFWKVARKTQDNNFLFLWHFLLVSLPITFALICLMRAFPFYRVWTYYAIFLAILVAYLAHYFIFSKKSVAYAYLLGINTLLVVATHFQFWREIQDFYDPQAYYHHKKLESKTLEMIAKQQKVYLSIEAFYVRFWLECKQATALIRQNPCKADVAVSEIPETPPLCQEAEEDIWFLRFYVYKQRN